MFENRSNATQRLEDTQSRAPMLRRAVMAAVSGASGLASPPCVSVARAPIPRCAASRAVAAVRWHASWRPASRDIAVGASAPSSPTRLGGVGRGVSLRVVRAYGRGGDWDDDEWDDDEDVNPWVRSRPSQLASVRPHPARRLGWISLVHSFARPLTSAAPLPFSRRLTTTTTTTTTTTPSRSKPRRTSRRCEGYKALAWTRPSRCRSPGSARTRLGR